MAVRDDDYLRAHGFQVAARPGRGEVQWVRRGLKLPQSKALSVCSREDKSKKKEKSP